MKKSLITIVTILMVVALGFALVGCNNAAPAASPSAAATDEATGEPTEATSDEAASATKNEYKFGYIAYNIADIWNDYSAKAFEYAADQSDVKVTPIVLDSKNDVEESVKCMESLIQQEVDGISIFPISIEQGAQLVKMANEAGIPVTIENFKMETEDPGDYIAAVACNYDDIGYAAMNFIAEQKPGAKVFFCAGQPGAGVYEKYQEGIDRALAELGDKIEIVGTEHGDWETEKAMNVTQNFIQSGKEFDYIFANNGMMAKGCYQALQEADMTNIPIVSTGGSPDDFKMLQEGNQAANMTAPVSIQGIQTFKNLYDFVVMGISPAEKFQPLPIIPATADKLDEFIAWDDYAAAYNYVYENAQPGQDAASGATAEESAAE